MTNPHVCVGLEPDGTTPCPHPATVVPVLLLAHKRAPKVVVRGVLDVPLCGAHQRRTLLKHLLNDAGWQTIVDGFARQQRMPPTRSRTALAWVPTDGPEATAARANARGEAPLAP